MIRFARSVLAMGIILGATAPVQAASACTVTPSQFNRLVPGKTLTQVNSILGCPCMRVASGALGSADVTAAEWRGPRHGTVTRVVFVGRRAHLVGWIRDR